LLPRYPVTAGVGLAALCVTLAWWNEWDIDPMLMDVRAWHGQPWRLVTSALPHLDVIHLAFNLYWLWVFGTLVEHTFGRLATGGVMVLFAAGSTAAEYALFEGGVGLSGVGYGLFGMLWVLSRRDPRLAGAVDGQTVVLFLSWFAFCCAMTATGAWQVANAAHAAGLILGILLGFTLLPAGRRLAFGALLSGTTVLIFLGATVGRPYVNLAGQAAHELAYLGYMDLERGRDESAAKRYWQALELDRGNPDWWYNLAVARQRLGQTEGAIDAFQHACDLRPGDRAPRLGIAALKAQLAYQKQTAGQGEEAVSLYREALAVDDRQAMWWYYLGSACVSLGRTESAREAYRCAVALEPANERYRAALGALPGAADEPK
jgi:GlpG protein